MTGRESLMKSFGFATKLFRRRTRRQLDGCMALSSKYPSHDHATAAVCHFGTHSRNSTINTTSSLSTSVSSSPKRIPFQINEAAQQGKSSLAERLLLEMHQEYNRTRNVAFQPRRAIFNMVLNAWARSGSQEAPQRAESILR
jgi:hypothetical protein